MLSTPEADAAVWFGDSRAIDGVTAGKAIVNCATLREQDMINLDAEVSKRGGEVCVPSPVFVHSSPIESGRFLEAPVLGSKVPAATGQLIVLCAGDESLFNEIQGLGTCECRFL